MGRMLPAGFAVFVRTTMLGHYRLKANAMRRCEAERENGVDARVYEAWVTFAVGEREDGEA